MAVAERSAGPDLPTRRRGRRHWQRRIAGVAALGVTVVVVGGVVAAVVDRGDTATRNAATPVEETVASTAPQPTSPPVSTVASAAEQPATSVLPSTSVAPTSTSVAPTSTSPVSTLPPLGDVQYSDEPRSGPLTAGHRGPRVRALQRTMVVEGLLAEEDVDRYFGSVTREALAEYQRRTSLAVSGEADLDTLRSLGILASERTLDEPLVITGETIGPASLGDLAWNAEEALSDLLGPPDRDARWLVMYGPSAGPWQEFDRARLESLAEQLGFELDDFDGDTTFCVTDWFRVVSWSDLAVIFAPMDPLSGDATTDLRMFSFTVWAFDPFTSSNEPDLSVGSFVPPTPSGFQTVAGVELGNPLSRLLELEPESDWNVLRSVYPGPSYRTPDGVAGVLEDEQPHRVIAMGAGPAICGD